MNINEKIGQRILALRKAQNLSQEALAHKSEVDRTYMTGVETGKRNVTVKVLEKIIKGLETDFGRFFDDKGFLKPASKTKIKKIIHKQRKFYYLILGNDFFFSDI